LTPEQLVKAAEGTEFGPSGFGEYGIHLKQATADATAFAKVLHPLVERQRKLEAEITGLMQEKEHLVKDAKGQVGSRVLGFSIRFGFWVLVLESRVLGYRI
jgi:hypothetical protein